jgi:hypothetical protein
LTFIAPLEGTRTDRLPAAGGNVSTVAGRLISGVVLANRFVHLVMVVSWNEDASRPGSAGYIARWADSGLVLEGWDAITRWVDENGWEVVAVTPSGWWAPYGGNQATGVLVFPNLSLMLKKPAD